jgi:hypothetical protein
VVPHLPELFSGSQASALLVRADPAQAAALRGYAELRWGAEGAVDAVARARWDAAAARWLLVVGGAAVLAVAALAVTMMLAGR